MKKISWFWIAICSLLIIIVFVSWQQVGKLTPSAEILTEQEASETYSRTLSRQGFINKVSQFGNII